LGYNAYGGGGYAFEAFPHTENPDPEPLKIIIPFGLIRYYEIIETGKLSPYFSNIRPSLATPINY
jgi:hypothetical protein